MDMEQNFDGKRLVVDEIHTSQEIFNFMSSLQLRKPFIVKPNWICGDYGHFTDPQILEWILRFLSEKGEVVLVESYSARNVINIPELKSPLSILSEYELKLVRKSEENFLKETGIRKVIDELGINYVNVAEEVLDSKTVDKEYVEKHVTEKYSPVLREELYGFLPEKLYTLRSGTFISLAKFKVFFTMCIKNMFGMIPEHVGYDSRFAYHGKGDKDLSQNIVDINKIYKTFFDIVGIVEGIHSLSYNIGNTKAEYKTSFGYKYDVLKNSGLIYYCNDPLWLDAFIHQQCGKNPMKTEHLREASKVFGDWSSELGKKAKAMENPLNVKLAN
jgi:uncharacterized protein (DUF362 family)